MTTDNVMMGALGRSTGRIGNVQTEEGKHSAAVAIREAGLDWTVSKQLQRYYHNGELHSFPDQYVLTRDDNSHPLSNVGKDYEAIQNEHAFDFFNNVTFIGGDAEYVRSGATQNGKKLFIEAKLSGDDIVISGRDKIEKRIYLWNSHGGNSFKVFFSPLRLYCQNQLTGSFQKNIYKQYHSKGLCITGVKIVHKGDVLGKMKDACDIINDAIIHFEAFRAVAQSMDDRAVNAQEVQAYSQNLTFTAAERKGEKPSTRIQNQRDAIETAFVKSPGNRGRTLWDLYNGATYWSDHQRSLNKGTELDENRFFGSGRTFKQRALDLAVNTLQGQPLELLKAQGL